MNEWSTTCYRCGHPADTVDHVVPRCLFPRATSAQFLKVPACKDCNNSTSLDEEYLRMVLTSSTANPVAYQVWREKTLRSLKREFGGLRQLLTSNMSPTIYLPFASGFEQSSILKADATRMNRVADKITRGLYYHVTGSQLAADVEMKFRWQPKDWVKDIALQADLICVDPDVFACRYAIGQQGGREVTIWWMLFYGSFLYVVTTDTQPTANDTEVVAA